MKYSMLRFLLPMMITFFTCDNFLGYAQQPSYLINRTTSQSSMAYFFGFWDYQQGDNKISSKDVVNFFHQNHRWLATDFKKANEKYMIGRIAFIGGGAFVITSIVLFATKNITPGGVMLGIGAVAIGFSVPFLLWGERERKKALHYYNKYIATTESNNSLHFKVSMSNIIINYNF